MIVGRDEFQEVVSGLLQKEQLAVDTETTSLRPYHGGRFFSIVIADDKKSYYFNYNLHPGIAPLHPETLELLKPLFSNEKTLLFFHNAKFDLHMLAREGIEVKGIIHCTQAIARVVGNDELAYSLDACAKRIGLEKSDAVEEYISEHHLWEWANIPGKKSRVKNKFFASVPFEVIVPYAKRDAEVTLTLGKYQLQALGEIDKSLPLGVPSPLNILDNEREFTKTCFGMEKRGILIDRDYCERAANHEMSNYWKSAQEFERQTGIPFKDSNKVLAEAFTQVGEIYPTTKKGNPSFTDDVLSQFESPLAKLVQEYRDAYKKCHTYYRNFLYHADADGVVHATIRQGGTTHGRVSYADPNLQNINKEEDASQPFLVRRAFIPRPDRFFFMLDYDQMEYRMMLDYAGQMDVIRDVQAGMDVHQATAQMLGVPRAQAKTLNFGLLYGLGKEALAYDLGTTIPEAYALKQRYFRTLPQVESFIRRVMAYAEKRGHIFNWAGRRLMCRNSEFAYTLPNHLISGGCADVVKIAMNRIATLLKPYQTKMLIQIHDELLFEGVREELFLIPEIKEIMESAYPARHLKLTCGVEHSFKSWGDKIEGLPSIN